MKVLYLIGKKEFSSSFVKKDLKILEIGGAEVTLKTFSGPMAFKRMFLKILMEDVKIAKQHDVIYTWWLTSWYPALISFISHKPLVVTSGGFDTVRDPALQYGALYDKKLRIFVKFVTRIANVITAVDISLKKQLEENLGRKFPNIVEVPTAFSPEIWKFSADKEKIAMTVCSNHDGSRIRHLVKGIDRFTALARKFPEYKFILVGYTDEILKKLEKNVPENITTMKFIPLSELIGLYGRSHIYCQLSRHEGLPSCVVEAILCGCIPVCSNVNGIPKLVKPPGIVFDFESGDFEEFCKLFKEIMETEIDTKTRERNRNYIIENFSPEKRGKRLVGILKAAADTSA